MQTERQDSVKILGCYIIVIFINFFWTTKRLSRTSIFLVSCPKGQVEKYVNVEVWALITLKNKPDNCMSDTNIHQHTINRYKHVTKPKYYVGSSAFSQT